MRRRRSGRRLLRVLLHILLHTSEEREPLMLGLAVISRPRVESLTYLHSLGASQEKLHDGRHREPFVERDPEHAMLVVMDMLAARRRFASERRSSIDIASSSAVVWSISS